MAIRDSDDGPVWDFRMFKHHPKAPNMREFPFVVVHPPIGTEVAILMGLLSFNQQCFSLLLENLNSLERHVVALNADVLFAGHAFALFLARRHRVIVDTHSI